MKQFFCITVLGLLFSCLCMGANVNEQFPDGAPIPEWFRQYVPTDINRLGKQYLITDYGVVNDSTFLQTKKIQSLIDKVSENGGGVVVVPEGTFLSGSLFFKQGTHLHLKENAVIKGSDDISHFQLLPSRIEGQSRKYFSALINADGVDGFTISGKGTLNGNGLRYWKSFWLRREYNPNCTNLEEMRPRILFVSNSQNIQVSGIRMINSPFWTSHYYKCKNIKLVDLYICSPYAPVKAPSSDAIDLDVCENVLVKNCYMSVNDDAVVLKGGKGPLADKDDNNGRNRNIIIEDCTFGFCHSALTCGSEAIDNHNIMLRRCTVDGVQRVLHLKMRPDTPQKYAYISVEDIKGKGGVLLDINPWTQFFDMAGQKEVPASQSHNISLAKIDLECNTLFNVKLSDYYQLSDFSFTDMNIVVKKETKSPMEGTKNVLFKNVVVNGKKLGQGV